MRKRYLYLYPLLIVASVIGLLYVATPKAHAALEGENGPILYIENPTLTEELYTNVEITPTPTPELSSVVTTNQEGTGDITAATDENLITSATISDPDTTGNYDIVYGTKVPVCEVDNEVASCAEDATQVGSDAVLNKVTIDINRNPITTPESTILDPLVFGDEKILAYNWVSGTSYSQDSNSVLVTQVAQRFNDNIKDYPNYFGSLLLFDANNISADPKIVLETAKDPCLSAGFAQNGDIYFSSCPNGKVANAGLYYFQKGTTEFNMEETVKVISKDFEFLPYFIDVSPDSSQLLVADILPTEDGYYCGYNRMVFYGQRLNVDKRYPGDCRYYLMDSSDGSYGDPLGKNEDGNYFGVNFVPTFFSPDGLSIIGTVYPQNNKLRSLVDVTEPYTALYSIANANIYALTNRTGVQEWSPVAVIPVTTVATTTTTPTLPDTGTNSSVIFALALILIALGASTLVRAKQNN